MSPVQRQLAVVDQHQPGNGLLIAFASVDRQQVDQHFGSSRGFVIHRLELNGGHYLHSVCQFDAAPHGHDDDKLRVRLAALAGCAAVYCLAVGPSAIRQLLTMGVQPLRLDQPTAITSLLDELQSDLRSGPRGWLARVLANRSASDGDRFQQMAHEQWQE